MEENTIILNDIKEAQQKLSNIRKCIENTNVVPLPKRDVVDDRLINVKGFPGYLVSTHGDFYKVNTEDGIVRTEELEIFYLKRSRKNKKTGNKKISREGFAVKIERKGRKCKKFVKDLILSSFDIYCPHVKEIKVINNTIEHIRSEETIMRVKQIDKNKPFNLYNARWDYINRGINHHKHKLTNEQIKIIRENRHMNTKELIEKYGPFPVTTGTIRSVMNGDSWRVRTDPICIMINSEDCYPNGLLINYLT